MIRTLPYLLALVLTLYALIDCVQTDESRVRGLPKVVWVFVILLFPFVGPLGWLLAGRPERDDGPGASPWGPRRQSERRDRRPKGPDDDPDFLKNL